LCIKKIDSLGKIGATQFQCSKKEKKPLARREKHGRKPIWNVEISPPHDIHYAHQNQYVLDD
jgi:hypothetical protein